jgi:cell division protein FtsI (penicillin-binding protein 3)
MNTVSASRLACVVLLFLCLYGLGIANLFRLQITNNNFFIQMAQQQYNVTITQTPPRALLYDRNHQPLALNKESLAAFITPNNLEDKKAVAAFLKQHFPQAHERLVLHGKDLFMYIKRRLTDEEVHLIEEAAIPDIHILQDPSRFYPVPSLGHTLGITDIDNKGISGIELICEQRLAGQPLSWKKTLARAFSISKKIPPLLVMRDFRLP